ncbi:MAG: S9 family peptidase, partial [Alicyclobacillus shizuokensis]|nr:S9 family peptidase [Alicyclobacillus shizuokensis]
TWLDEVALVEPEPFYYKSGGDWTLQGWVMKPARFESGKRYPVILEIHGGPQTHYGYAMFHEMQWLAAQGYAVVYTNPRGGTSYGQEFVNAVRHHYGEDDAADVLNGLEAALSQFDFLDGERVAVTGGSYGGFMTNWLIGHTQRFFAAVTQRSISNWISFYGCSDIGPLFVESQLGVSDVIAERERLWQMSPLAHAAHIRTPLLILHSENDLRCPMEQAEQLYTTLKRRGAEVELLRIPNASHGLSRGGKPKLRVARLQAIFGFIDAHLPDVDSLT